MKKVCVIIIAAGFLFGAFPVIAGAAQPFLQHKLLQQSIEGLQQKIYAEDCSALSAVTIQFLDDILAAGVKNSKPELQLAVMGYVSDVQQIQAALDNETKCLIPFGISATVATVGMIQELASGNSAFCMVINLTNNAADIMSAKTNYDICIIDASATPDEAERAALAQKLMGIETYDFVTNAIEVFLCIEAPSAGDYISLLFNLIGIFQKP